MVKVFFRVVTEVNSVQFRDELETSPEILEKKRFQSFKFCRMLFGCPMQVRSKFSLLFGAIGFSRVSPTHHGINKFVGEPKTFLPL